MSQTIDPPVDGLPDLPPLFGDMTERFAGVVSRQALQQPSQDVRAAVNARRILESVLPIVAAPEVRKLRQEPADVANGKVSLLQGGDCAETSESNTEPHVRANAKTLLQMATVLTYGVSTPVVKMTRIAGQYARPRSKDADGDGLLSYRGDMVNGVESTEGTRVHDPVRMVRTYTNASVAMNLMHVLTGSGTADLHRLHEWNREFTNNLLADTCYEDLAREINRALQFMAACGVAGSSLQTAQIYCSHEALVVDYKRTILRLPGNDGNQELFNPSAHQLRIGECTHGIGNSYINLTAMIDNPVGAKVGPTITPEEAAVYADKLGPSFQPGRPILTSRLGNDKVRSVLPPIVGAVEVSNHRATWQCDPIHDNTYSTSSGYKIRHFDCIADEAQDFFEVHRSIGSHPGGIHVELTGENVTECLGGAQDISDVGLPGRHASACGSRLNTQQSLGLAFLVTKMLRN